MLGELIPCGGGDPIPLLQPKLLIGRRSRCDITLRFPNVSSHHCELEFVEGYWSLRDLGSRNGTKVNGVRCQSKWLMPGDVVAFAKHRYELMYTPSGDAPPPEDNDPFSLSLMEKAGLVRDDRPRSSASSTRVMRANSDSSTIDPTTDGVPADWLKPLNQSKKGGKSNGNGQD